MQPARSSWMERLDHGSVLGFPSYKEANAMLDEWLLQYPEALQQRTIGSSFQGRPIYAYIIGGPNGKPAAKKPQVLITALMHAREPASLTVVLYFLGHLLEQHAAGVASALYSVSMREIWVVPFVNPDGYIANERLKNKMVRKNQRPTCGSSSQTGVDINRNFGFHWAKEFSRCSEEYQGERPFSEPETQALKKICEENEFAAAMNFHSFGGMLTYPFNYAKAPYLPPDDQRIFNELAGVFQWSKMGPAMKVLGYTAPGESDDWLYGAKHIISMSPEVGPEWGDFWPPRKEIAGIDARNFMRIMHMFTKQVWN